MRSFKYLLLIPILIPSLSGSSVNTSLISLTGFELDIKQDTNKIYLPIRITVKENTDISCKFQWILHRDDKAINIEAMEVSGFTKCTNKYLDFRPSVKFTSLGIDNYFEIKLTPSDLAGEIISKKIHFNNKGVSSVTFKESDNNIGVSSGYCIESYSPFDTSKNYILEDRITFLNYEDLVVEDIYLNFDISRFEFNYIGNKDKDLLEGEFIFAIYDKYNLFKDLPLYKDSQYRYIPLKVNNKNNGNSVFTFKNNIYYDPITRNPSLTYKENYIETNKLYFPKDEINKLKQCHCILSFDIDGYTKFNMSSSFDIRFLKNYFGECEDSEYCIHINEDKGENVREKVVDVTL